MRLRPSRAAVSLGELDVALPVTRGGTLPNPDRQFIERRPGLGKHACSGLLYAEVPLGSISTRSAIDAIPGIDGPSR